MVNLAQLSVSDSYAQTSGSGFGTRALCRRLSRHSDAPTETDMWLTGLRRANPFNATTNPVPNAHMRSPGGFMETFPGLRDGGDIQFEATFKNDVPSGSTDFQAWQAPKEGDDLEDKSFFHSLFFDREPFEMWVIPPQWTRGLFIARGYASMAGPFPHEMEGVVNFQASFKISGRPMLLRGERVGTAVMTGTEIMADSLATAVNERYRAVKDDLLFESWSDREDAPGTIGALTFGDALVPADSSYNLYKYTEDAGFGSAF